MSNTPTTTAIEPITLVAGIIQNQMDLAAGQVAFANQDYQIPTSGPFVIVGYLGPSEMVASQSFFDPGTQTEWQQATFKHTVQIEIMSLAPDNTARIRKEEIALSLRSSYSLRQQDVANMGIAWLQSDFIDASYVDETGMLNRFITTCAVNALHQKQIAAQYLGTFPIEVFSDTQDGRQTIENISPVNPF